MAALSQQCPFPSLVILLLFESGTSAPQQPRFVSLWFLTFHKAKIKTIDTIKENTQRSSFMFWKRAAEGFEIWKRWFHVSMSTLKGMKLPMS